MDQAHLIEAMDGVLRRLGGTARRWRVDRMATVIVPGSADVQASFAPVAKHYGAIDCCLPASAREPQRIGGGRGAFRHRPVVADLGRRFARDGPGEPGPVLVDHRRRPAAQPVTNRGATRRMGADHGGRRSASWPRSSRCWRCRPLPFPATIEQNAPVDHQASVAFRGNRYSVPPGLAGVMMTLRHRLGTVTVDVVSPAGVVLVTHRLAAGRLGDDGAHPRPSRRPREGGPRRSSSTTRPCDRKANRPPGAAALAERAKLLGPEGAEPSVDLAGHGRGDPPRLPGRVEVSAGEAICVTATSEYQRLRAHLAFLRMGAAAEALPACLNEAVKDQAFQPGLPGTALGRRG